MNDVEMTHKDGYTQAETVVKDKYGICTRPAAMIVVQIMRRERNIEVRKADGQWLNAKEIMALLTLEGWQGSPLTIRVEGVDEEAEYITRQLCLAIADAPESEWPCIYR